jgi:hypothetical protein
MKFHAAFVQTLVAMLTLSVAACGAGEDDSKDHFGMGFIIGGATPSDVGLPTYPGAQPYTERDEDSSSSADIDINTPLFGLKVVAMKLETGDAPEKVAAFYKRALSQYGRVLECVDGESTATKTRRDAKDNEELTCDQDEPEADEVVYKAGTDSNQRIVAIKPYQGGARFSLVHVHTRD